MSKRVRRYGQSNISGKKAAFVLILLVLFLLTAPFHQLSANYGFLFLPILFFLPGFNIASPKTIVTIDFAMIFFIASCLAIGTVGTALGVGQLIAAHMAPIMASMGTAGAMYTMLIFGILLNFVLTPTAMMATLPAPITTIAVALGIDPLALIYPFKISCDCIFLPYEYVPYLIFFSFGAISMGDFVKFASIKIAILFVVMGLLMIPYWTLIGIV